MSLPSITNIPKNLPYQAGIVQVMSHPTWDLILIFALVAMAFFYGMARGKRRISAAIIYTYVDIAIFSVLPVDKFAAGFTGDKIFWFKSGLFLVLLIALIFLLGSKKGRGFSSSGSWWRIFLLSITQVGLLAHIMLGFLPADQAKNLAPLTRNFFANQNYHLWWILIPIVLVAFTRKMDYRED